MDFIKNAGFGVQVAVVSGYLAAVKGHNVVESMKALGDINKQSLQNAENYKHVGGRVLQTPFFLVGMAIGIVADVFSGLVNGAKYIGQAIYNVCVVLKAKVTGNQVADDAYCTHDFAESHKSFVDPKKADEKSDNDSDKGPIVQNVTMFNTAVAKATSDACTKVAQTLGLSSK